MQLSDFTYDLPESLIATVPLAARTASRMMVLPEQGGLVHQQFSDLVDHLQPQDCLVFNNTKVMPARLYGQKETGGKVELLIERLLPDGRLLAHMKANKSPKPGTRVLLNGTLGFEVTSRQDNLFILKNISSLSTHELMQQHGEMPLPPYMKRAANHDDDSRYQTVYAQHLGAVAAPTAGLHFDEALLAKIQAKGVTLAQVTLHVGAGTFLPVKVDNIAEHTMHSEWIHVTPDVVDTIKRCKAKGGKVIAVGTTSLRSLETAAATGTLQAYQGDTDIFITPGYQFQIVDKLITNFHLPESTLLMLVSAFSGHQRMMQAYQTAIEKQYRFFSYGDAMLLSRV